jgi:hypothetical protein
MEITVRGWGRDMGTRSLVSHDLSEFLISNDPYRRIRWGAPGLFANYGTVNISWGQDLKHQGSYLMNVEYSQADIFKLFKASYGSELDVDLLEQGFTVSEALKKRMLSEIKMSELTLGDLAKLTGGSAAAPEPKEPEAPVRLFRRRL